MNGTALSVEDAKDLTKVIGGGVLLAVSATGIRLFVPRLDVPLTVYYVQYTLGFIFLGILLLLLMNSNTQYGRVRLTSVVLFLGLGLLVPPSLNIVAFASNLMYLVLIVVGGIVHFRFHNPSNTFLILAALLLGLEFYLFGSWFIALAYLQADIPEVILELLAVPEYFVLLWLLTTWLLLTYILYKYARALGRELHKVNDDSTTAEYLGKIL